MEKYESRKDVPDKYKWDLTDFFKNEEEFLSTLKETQKKLEKYASFKGCTKDKNKLYEFLEYDLDVTKKIIDLSVYAYTKSDEDLSVAKNTELLGLTEDLETQYQVAMSFFEPELLSLDKEEYNKLFELEDLKKYQPLLDKMYRYKEHHLSEDEEKLVGLLTQTLSSNSTMSSQMINSNNDYGTVTLEDGSNEVLTLTNYRKLMKKSSREKRKEIYLQFNKVLNQYSSTFAGFLNNYVKTEDTLATIYKYDSSWQKKLFQEELTDKVFTSLVNGVESKLDVVKKFNDIKAKNLGVDELMPWDSPIEFYKGVNKEYTIEEGNNLILEALKPLGEDYIKHFKRAINENNIDYCQYKGKCSGGYNISSINQINSKILMSFNGDLDSVSTIAHEGGHHVNHQYLYENCEAMYRDHSSIVAEVASLTNECLLSSYLSNSSDKEEALSGISNIVWVINNNLIGAVLEGNIEKEMYDHVHNGSMLTNDYLKEITKKELLKFSGNSELKHEYQSLSWITRSHYYMNFYLYSYAICISVASYVAKNILAGNKEMLENYLKFLKCGSDVKIIDVFKILGIDLEDQNVYISAMDYLNELLDKFVQIKEN